MSQNAFAQIERETNEAEGLREHARMERMEMTEQKKDYSKLRPFDLEAAKRGEPICFIGADKELCDSEFVAESPNGLHCFRGVSGSLYIGGELDLYMKPLAWVEGKPVYVGDTLYSERHGKGIMVKAPNFNGGYAIEFHGGSMFSIEATYFKTGLTWNPPKVKREVKLLAYLDADQLFWLRETATPKWPAVRVQSEDKTIEVEE